MCAQLTCAWKSVRERETERVRKGLSNCWKNNKNNKIKAAGMWVRVSVCVCVCACSGMSISVNAGLRDL